MNHAPSLDSIEERLRRTLEQFTALPEIGEKISIGVPLSSGQLNRVVKNMSKWGKEWLETVPALQDVKDWVEVHWDTERQTEPPAGTVSDGEKWGNNGDVQLDSLTATCKLLLAAAGHGVETVAKCAREFAEHGMIEVRSFYLLKGASVLDATPLDDYCILLSYRDAMQKVKAQLSLHFSDEDLWWPPEQATNVVCARNQKLRAQRPPGERLRTACKRFTATRANPIPL